MRGTCFLIQFSLLDYELLAGLVDSSRAFARHELAWLVGDSSTLFQSLTRLQLLDLR